MSMLGSVKRVLVALATSFAISGTALAQDYPSQPIHIVVPYNPGGPSDLVARILSDGLSRSLGQPVVVDNRPGAAGVIGHTAVANAAPDGYTLIISNFSDVLNTALGSQLSYDFEADFQPISGLASTPFILVVHPSLPIESLDDLIAYAKDNPRQLTYGSAGIGTGSHLATELLALRADIELRHVPYTGVALASQDLLGGQLSMMFMNAINANEAIRSGQLRAIGVSTAERTSVAPDVPTLSELGLEDFDIQTWNGVQAPAGTPMEIIDLLAEEASRIMHDPEIGARLSAMGSEPIPSTPEEFSAYIRSEIERWTDVAKAANIHASN